MADNTYREVIEFLNSQDEARLPVRRTHRLPLESYSASDCEFFFTICARGQGQPFTNPQLAAAIIDALLWRRERHNWILYCYCLMPDHLHFLAKLQESGDSVSGDQKVMGTGILAHIAQFKSYTTTQIWWKHGGTGQLWQKSSYDKVFRYMDSPESAARYVVNNPVRKGLVTHWEDYPYSAMVDPW